MREEEGSLKFLQTIYRNPEVPLPVRMKAAAIAIEYELPRLAVTATVNATGDFADQLERAIQRSRRASPMIDSKPSDNVSSDNVSSNVQRPHVPVSNGGGKPFVPDRRFRRW
jgi:hypothetical protein